MKKIAFAVCAFVFGLALSTNAFAAFAEEYDQFYTVGSNGSTVLKDTFGIDDPAPWIYIKLSSKFVFGVDQTTTVTKWNSPDGDEYTVPDPAPQSPAGELWFSLANWGTVKETGVWTILGTSTYANVSKGFDYGTTTFTVTPEPISAALFLMGGAGLVGTAFRKKN